jgi:hypothetical protein
MWAASEDKTSVFHRVRQSETILQLQLEWLARVRQSLGREVTEETPEGKRRTRVEPLYCSLSVNSGKYEPHTYEELKASPVLSTAIILDRLQRVTYAQQGVLGQADVLEEVNWTDQAIQRGLARIEKLNQQLLQFKQPVRIPPRPAPATGRKRSA